MAEVETSAPSATVNGVPPAPVAKKEDDRDRGIARIKKEYLIDKSAIEVGSSTSLHRIDDDAAESGTNPAQQADSRGDGERNAKRRKPNGQNKNRQFPQTRDRGPKMCRAWERTGECDRSSTCKFAHSWEEYFKTKPQDIHHDPSATFNTTEPYIVIGDCVKGGEDVVGMRLDTSTVCPVKKDLGWCPYGMKCRFLGNHLKKVDAEADGEKGPANEQYNGWRLTDNVEPEQKEGWRQGETNWQNPDVIRQLRFQSYEYKYSKEYLRQIEPHKPFYHDKNRSVAKAPAAELDEEEAFNDTAEGASSVTAAPATQIPGESEAMDVPMRPEEKKRLNWENGLYLAPLTTVGNLPFRRLCVDYGATITCSEMALSQQLITGQNDEWALVRRHESERHFGIQVAGGYPNVMVPAAEMIGKELRGGIDFVDVNLGCPIDLVFNQGAGSALMDSAGRLGKILVGMNRALGDIPLTVKFRTGVASGKNNAHKLIPRFANEWGASAMTLHGRSRQQRYSKLADWAYIKQCATTLRSTLADADLPPVPIFGNGDCFSAQQYYEEKEASGVDGVMVARGALIKPWIFTEIQERREWDITGTERLEGIRKFAEYGLSHWGSDTQGINTTRRFLLEALSFQHRYVPLGLLERLPAQMNERPPAFRGRNELETLLSSPFCEDWVKISEMFLGKVTEDYKFVPKHKSNSYGGEEAQGRGTRYTEKSSALEVIVTESVDAEQTIQKDNSIFEDVENISETRPFTFPLPGRHCDDVPVTVAGERAVLATEEDEDEKDLTITLRDAVPAEAQIVVELGTGLGMRSPNLLQKVEEVVARAQIEHDTKWEILTHVKADISRAVRVSRIAATEMDPELRSALMEFILADDLSQFMVTEPSARALPLLPA